MSSYVLPKLENPACAEVDPHLFFPPQGNSRLSKAAREVCFECPELEPCRDFALTHSEIQHGIWGGLTNREIRAIRGRIKNANKAA